MCQGESSCALSRNGGNRKENATRSEVVAQLRCFPTARERSGGRLCFDDAGSVADAARRVADRPPPLPSTVWRVPVGALAPVSRQQAHRYDLMQRHAAKGIATCSCCCFAGGGEKCRQLD